MQRSLLALALISTVALGACKNSNHEQTAIAPDVAKVAATSVVGQPEPDAGPALPTFSTKDYDSFRDSLKAQGFDMRFALCAKSECIFMLSNDNHFIGIKTTGKIDDVKGCCVAVFHEKDLDDNGFTFEKPSIDWITEDEFNQWAAAQPTAVQAAKEGDEF